MNRHIYALCAILTGMILLTSCLGDDSNSNITYYNDTAITAFSVATVNRYIHTTSATGGDSVYQSALSNPVVFTIDQEQRKIYNTDSLPSDCDLTHVLVNITAKNNGIIAIADIDGEQLTPYSSSDSIDFSQPREIRAYSNDALNYRAYEIILNKHQVETGKMLWEKAADSDFPTSELTAQWEASALAAGLSAFIGAGTTEGYAFSSDGQLMVSRDQGETWVPDSLDDDAALLPLVHFSFVSTPFTLNSDTDCQFLVGVSTGETRGCVVWRKLAEYAEDSEPSKWVILPIEGYNRYTLPISDDLSLVYYQGHLLAFSSNGNVYESRDNGITWKTNASYTYPADIHSPVVEAVVDDNNYLWLRNKENGEVWRGILIE